MRTPRGGPAARRFGPWILLALLAAAVSFSFQGSRGLYEPTEGRYCECAREMLETGDYLEPKLEGRHHWTKPPLAYWAVAEGMALFGENAWGARFANALAFWLTVLLVAALGAALWNGAAGVTAGLVYATSLFPAAAANSVSTDTLLTLWTTAAVLCYVLAVRRPRKGRLWGLGMWACLGLGFMTKGPPALLPLAAIAAYQQLRRPVFRLLDPAGLAVFAVIGLPWYLVVCVRNPGLFSYFMGDEVVRRVASDMHHRNPQWFMPIVMYVPLLTLGAGAWSRDLWRLASEKRLLELKTLWSALRGTGAAAFLLMWLLLPLAVFSLSRSRLPLYVLPLFAPVALAAARWIVRGSRTVPSRVWVIACASAVFIAAAKAASARVEYGMDMKALRDMCVEAAGPEPEVYVLNQEKLLGLRFYLGGRMKRMSLTGREDWSDAGVSDLVRGMRRSRRDDVALVSRDYDLHLMRKVWEEAGLDLACLERRRWAVCAPPEPGDKSGPSG